VSPPGARRADERGTGGTPEGGSEPRFEDALVRLEQIVVALEAGKLSLEDSLRAFEEGTRLLRLCHRQLAETEQRIEQLVADEEGTRTQPFRWDEEPG
jgi:exodeoxyribonuclease VII small subunit